MFNDKLIEMHGSLDDGLDNMTHINFINISKDEYAVNDDYLFSNYKPYTDKTDNIAFEESIHQEKMLYLKIWENYYFLKQLTQIINLANGKSYDWELKIKIDSKNTKSGHIRNNIKERLKNVGPQILSIINEAYSPQIRNAIAHSQYTFIQGGLKYNNFGSDPYANIDNIGYEEWERRFTLTMSLFYYLFQSLRVVHNDCAEKALKNNNTVKIRGSKKYGHKIHEWEYFDIGDRWVKKR